MRQIEQDKLKLILELKGNPIVLVACKKQNLAPSTFYRWKTRDRRFTKEVNRAITRGRETVSDVAEAHLINSVKKGEMRSVLYWLKVFRHPYKKMDKTTIEIRADKPMLMKSKPRTDGAKVPEYVFDQETSMDPKLSKQLEKRVDTLIKLWFKRNDREKALISALIEKNISKDEIERILKGLPKE